MKELLKHMYNGYKHYGIRMALSWGWSHIKIEYYLFIDYLMGRDTSWYRNRRD